MIVQDHTDAVWEAVWDMGFDGVGKEKYGGILIELYRKADVMDIARQDKLKVRLAIQSITETPLINDVEQSLQSYKDVQIGSEDAGQFRREYQCHKARQTSKGTEDPRGW